VSEVRRRLVHALTAVLASALVAATLVALDAGAAEAKVPKAARNYTAAIEPLASYVGQSTCSPAAKQGTLAFANLLLRTYPHSRSLGISRACKVGGQSEHKEGRAFDWGVSVNNARDRAAVASLMTWLLKKDAYGNRYAMARRLGIQYMIWNRRIWGAYSASAGWRKYTGSNPHTDHVHFSLSWAGARKQTSFWNPRNFPNSSGSAPTKPKPKPGQKPAPSPTPRPEPTRPAHYDWPDPNPDGGHRQTRAVPQPRAPRTLAKAAPLTVERISVPTARKAGVRTRKALVAGHRYLLEVSGTYRYQRKKGSVADAECSTRAGASWWQRERSLRSDQWYADHLDLYVDGQDLQAQADNGQSCDDKGHTYRWVYEPRRTGRVPFAVWDPIRYQDNRGKLSVRILDLGTVRDSMTWTVPARDKAGATSPGLLQGGRDYVVTVAGTWRDGRGATADAECAQSYGRWRRDADSYDMLAGLWSYDSLVPRVGGVRTMPLSGGSDCDPRHRYSWVQHVDRTSPLNVRVSDPGRFGDNKGALRVTVKPYERTPGSQGPTPGPTPSPAPLPKPQYQPEQLQVDSRSQTAVTTKQQYAAGTSLRVTVTGMYLLRDSENWVVADAECTIPRGSWRWRSTGFDGLFNGTTSPLGDLMVNRTMVTWKPSDGGGDCDRSDAHRYTYDLTTSKAGPLSFVVVDDSYGDNRGQLDVVVEPR
jgi:hypothetical protein